MTMKVRPAGDVRGFVQSIFKGASFLVISTAVSAVTGFLFKYILIRNWSPADYGIYTIVITIAGILGFFNEFSLNCTTTILLAKRDDGMPSRKFILYDIFTVFGLLTLTVTLIAFIVTRFEIATPFFAAFRRFLWLILPIVMLTAFTNICYGILRAYKKMHYEAMINGLKNLMLLIALAVLFHFIARSTVPAVVLSTIVVQALTIIVLGLFFTRVKRIDLPTTITHIKSFFSSGITSSAVKRILPFSFAISMLSLSSILILSVDRMLIPQYLSTSDLGLYSGAALIVAIPRFVSGAIANAAMPWLAEQGKDLRSAKVKYLRFLVYCLVIAVAGYGLCIYFSRTMIHVILKPEYATVLGPMRILFLGAFFSDIFLMNSTFIASLGKNRDLAVLLGINLLAVLANILLNVLLIPQLRLNGAAAANLAAFMIIAAGSTIQVLAKDR